jgi:hypothetical protein
MTKLEIKKSETPTMIILVKVFTSEDEYSSADYAFLELSNEFITLVRTASEEVKKLKEKFNSSTYCIEIWNYLPIFLCEETVCEIFGDDFDDSFEEFIYIDKPYNEDLREFVDKLCEEKRFDTVSQDATRLVITQSDFRFSSYLKHTKIVLDTSSISINELDKVG